MWEQAGLAVLLAAVAGFVDGAGYLTLYHMFTAHMSGNSIATGVHLGGEDWGAAFHRAFPIPVFVAGVALGAALGEAFLRRGFRSAFALGLGLEAALLLAFMAGGDVDRTGHEIRRHPAGTFYLLAALPALAMGVQNAMLRRVGNATVRTTYISGMLTNMAEEAVQFLYWFHDHARGERGRPLGLLLRLAPRQPTFHRALLRLAIWTAYVGGAVLAAWLMPRWGLACLALPVGCLAALILLNLIHPVLAPVQHRPGK